MQKYDISLKLLLRSSGASVLHALTGGVAVGKWLDVEMPEVRNTRVDLLGEMADGNLLHIELQSTHDTGMALRMAEYCLRVYRLFGRFPRQVLLYVGQPPLLMATTLRGPSTPRCAGLAFGYEAVDIRDFDSERLLESVDIGDNMIAVLAALRDQRTVVRRILARIAELEPTEREAALGQLLRIAGLRELEEVVEREARGMPVFNPIMDNKVLGREIKRGIEIGRVEGELKILRRLMETRFGPIPDWAEKQIARYSVEQAESLAVRVLSAESLEDLLK
jgi:hypothetical protein